MADPLDFQPLFTKLTEAQSEAEGGALQISIQELGAQSDAIAELMQAASELAEPELGFFTRA
jgi:hypothetical protein